MCSEAKKHEARGGGGGGSRDPQDPLNLPLLIVSELDSENPDDDMKIALKKKMETIWRKSRFDWAKALAEKRFLSRKIGHRTKDFPDIGQTIEEFVQERNVVQTGLLTLTVTRLLRRR